MASSASTRRAPAGGFVEGAISYTGDVADPRRRSTTSSTVNYDYYLKPRARS